jgi:hypothetical protein
MAAMQSSRSGSSPARSRKPQTGRLMKAECPSCQMIVYLSRGAAIRHGMPSCACGGRVFFSRLEVQMDAVPELAHEHPDYRAWTERQIRSAVRDNARAGMVQLRCGGCNAWVSATNERHSCGFHNDIRGNRNHGRWVEGASRAREEMPF